MRDGIVGIMAERSIEMIVGLLGIMKAGAAYLPIDAEYPGDRIKYMLEDSHVKLLLYQECLKDRITFNVEDVVDAAEVECLVLDKKNFSHRRQAKPKNIYQKGDLAYIIFTSGSTGKPKGVMVQHNSIVNTLLWRKSYYEFGPGDAVLQVPSFSFDSSVEDIFTPLISGCKLVLIRPENMFDLAYVRKVIPGNGVNHFLLVPGFYKTFLGAIPGVLTGFKSITVAGDNFTRELVKEHFEKLPDVGLFNEYGPTENSVCATVYRFHRHHTRVLIGSPINNVKCYILDKEGRLSAVNTPGELYLAGSSLARAYLNRPGLTAERFVDNPFEAGKKMYRTGDMARWLPDGNIEFFGRIDHQVKIRGFRIELGEIESQLQRIEGIKEAVVIAREETGTEKKLTAYIVAEQPIDVPVTREHLLKVLPDYMVPSYFIRVEEILLTPNGKVDRRTLSSHEVRLGTGVEYVAPTNQLEKTIANIWTEVLQLDKVGIHDNFFDLGGDSMNIIQVSLKLKEAFERDIRVVTMFRYTTIHSLAGYLSQQDTDSMTSPEEIDETIEMMKNSNLMLMGDDDE
jgi:bacitracin synthase 3